MRVGNYFSTIFQIIYNFEVTKQAIMLKKLLNQLFDKLEGERDNDKKTKNGNAVYFVEEILENKLGKPNYISARAIKDYYDKYVEEKENKAGEPSSELKNIIAKYLGYEGFLEFETKNKEKSVGFGSIKKTIKKPFFKWMTVTILIVIISVAVSYETFLKSKDCLVWKIDHYEEIECKNEVPNPLLKDVNIKEFKKVTVSDTTVFFINGHPVIWYGKSSKGELEYFNSRGVHPTTMKELKPITEYLIKKYVYKNE